MLIDNNLNLNEKFCIKLNSNILYLNNLNVLDFEIFFYYYITILNKNKIEFKKILEDTFFSNLDILNDFFFDLNHYFYILFFIFLKNNNINFESIFVDKKFFRFNRLLFNELFFELKKKRNVKQLLTFSEVFLKIELEDEQTAFTRRSRNFYIDLHYIYRILYFYFKSIKFVKIKKRFSIIKYWLV